MFTYGFKKIAVSNAFLDKAVLGFFEKKVVPAFNAMSAEQQKQFSSSPKFIKYDRRVIALTKKLHQTSDKQKRKNLIKNITHDTRKMYEDLFPAKEQIAKKNYSKALQVYPAKSSKALPSGKALKYLGGLGLLGGAGFLAYKHLDKKKVADKPMFNEKN